MSLSQVEYLNSEKYQFKERDWDAPGNIKNYITKLNRIRHQNRALREYENPRFQTVENEQIIFYSKATEALDSIILVLVNLDPYNNQSGFAYVLWKALPSTMAPRSKWKIS